MAFEIFERRASGSRGNLNVPYVGVFSSGMRFNKAAYEKWIKGCGFVQFWIDKSVPGKFKLAFKPLESPTIDSYRICKQGDAKNPNFYVGCRALVILWGKSEKGRTARFTARNTADGLLELIPLRNEE